MSPPSTINAVVEASVREHGSELALTDPPNRASFFFGEPRRFTWTELDAAVTTLSRQLTNLGASPGTSVGIQLPNVGELVISILACARIGAVAVPFPIQHRSHELRHGISAADVRIMITYERPDRPDHLQAIADLLDQFSDAQLATFGETSNDATARLSISNEGVTNFEESATHDARTDDIVTICWTSGTTGEPKGVPRSHSMWLASGRVQLEEISITTSDRILCPFPVVNMAGIGGMLVPWALAGASLHLHQPLDLQVFLGQIQAERITYTVAPPPILNMLVSNEQLLDSIDLTHIRTISSGSAPLDPWMVEAWEKRGIEIVNLFGSNEGAAMLSTRASVPDPTDRARFFPVPTRPEIEVRLVDIESGEEIRRAGIPGELRLRGDTVFDGYLGSGGDEFDDQGFFRTGDIFELAGDDAAPNLLRFVDRSKDIIIRGGMNISAAEVESLVSSHESVAECAAVAFPDVALGQRVGLFVVAATGASPTLDDIVGHMRSQGVASYKLPERLELVESLPRNVLGKVTKPELRAVWAEAD